MEKPFNSIFRNLYILMLVVILVLLILFRPCIGQEAVMYLQFVKKLVAYGNFDLGISGMHGQSFLMIPVYFISNHSDFSSNIVSIICYLLNIPLIYKYVKDTYSEKAARVSVYGYLLMARILMDSFYGNSFSTQIFLMLLTLILINKNNILTAFIFPLSVMVKPSSIFLFPFLFKLKNRKYLIITTSLILIGTYFILTKLQSGYFLNSLGVDSSDVNFSLIHIFKNFIILVYYFFSIPHIETVPNHAFSLLTSQALILFGLIGIFYYKKYVKDPIYTIPIMMMSFFAGILFSFFDPIYVLPGTILLLIIGAEFTSKHMRLLPLILITGGFEFVNLHIANEGLIERTSYSFIIYYAVISSYMCIYELYKFKNE